MIKMLCCVSALTAFALNTSAVTLETFKGTEIPVSLNKASERLQQFDLVQVPDGSGKAGHLSWEKNRFKYAEPIFRKMAVLPEFTDATLTVKVYTAENCPVGRFNLRLIDAAGEVFQWDQNVSWTQPGWKTVTFQLSPNNFNICWGGNNNKKFDLPLKLFGFGVDFKGEGTPGEMWIGEITITTTGGEKVTAVTPFTSFDPTAKWIPAFYNGQGKITPAAGGGLAVTGNAQTCVLRDRMWNLVSYKKPNAITLYAKLNSGDAAIKFILRGAGNKTADSQEIKLKQGDNLLTFDLNQTIGNLNGPIEIVQVNILSMQRKMDIELKKADFVTAMAPLEAVQGNVLTETPIHVMKNDGPKKFQLQFSNTAETAVNFNAEATFEDFFGNRVTREKIFSMKAGETLAWQPEWQPERYGIWWVNFKLTDPKNPENSRSFRRSFAYIDPAGPTPGLAKGFLFSICTHTERWGDRDKALEVMAAGLCGAKVIRTGPGWETIQPVKGEWNWEPMDKIVDMYGKEGMELQYILAFTARWAAPVEKQQSSNWLDWNRAVPEDAAWRAYASAMAKRYKDKIRYWEIWNEPDLNTFAGFTVDEYVQMMKSAYQEIKKIDPKLQVMTGGFATLADHPSRKDLMFHEKTLTMAKGSFDIHAYHEHCAFNNYAQHIEEKFIPLRQKTGTAVPWYANETAISSMDGTEHFQAETLFKKLLYAWARGAIGYTWYDLRNDGFDPKDGEHNFGMLTTDFYPKAIYPAYNALVNVYRDLQYDRQFDFGPNIWAFVFKGDNRITIPCWNESSSAATRHIIIKTDAAKAERIDLMGNVDPVPVLDGMTTLEIAATPASLNLIGATKADPAGTLVQTISGDAAVPGQEYPLTVKLTNPLASEREFSLKITLPPEINAERFTQTVKLGPQKQTETVFNLKISPQIKAEYGNAPRVKIAYTVDGTPWKGTLSVPVNLAIAIPAGSIDRKPDFVLNHRDQVVSLCANDPAKVHLIWRDANDLSAKIWLSAEKQELRLKAIVTDDIHNQPNQGNAVWAGDNIQFAMQVPGQAGCWEIGLSHLNSGKAESFIWSTPNGFNRDKAVTAIRLETSRQGKDTVYNAVIPLKTLGLTPGLLHSGIRFNLLINDNDGELREGWIHIAPNLGTNKNPASYPFIIFR